MKKLLNFILIIGVLTEYSCKKNALDKADDFENFPASINLPANADLLHKTTLVLKSKIYDKDIAVISISKGNIFKADETSFAQESKTINVIIDENKIEFYLKPDAIPYDYVNLNIAVRNSNLTIPVMFERLFPDTAYFMFSKIVFDTGTTDVNFSVKLINKQLNKVSDNLNVYFSIDSIHSANPGNPCVADVSPFVNAKLENGVLQADNILHNTSQQKGIVYLSASYSIRKNSSVNIKKTITWK